MNPTNNARWDPDTPDVVREVLACAAKGVTCAVQEAERRNVLEAAR